MNYINTLTSAYPVTESQIRADFPNTSFGLPFLPPEEYAFVFPYPQPSFDHVTQFVTQGTPELTNKGHYEERWTVVERYTDQAEKDAAILADAIAKAQALQLLILEGMTALFDATAKQKNYDNRITCALRAGYPGPFHDEGVAFATWMDNCNAMAYAMLAEVQAGTRPMPETVYAALALLPTLEW